MSKQKKYTVEIIVRNQPPLRVTREAARQELVRRVRTKSRTPFQIRFPIAGGR